MGLSGRKIKQRIPQDPRNLSWADDASRFGSTYLAKLGFNHSDKNATLGVSGVGLAQHLKVHHKLDMLGIGAQHTKDPNGIAWKQNQDFENLLKRLNANSEDPAEDGVDPVPIDGFRRAQVDDPAAGSVGTGPETEGRDEGGKVKKRKSKKKKRLRDDCETSKIEERKSKKRKQVESTSAAPTSGSVEEGPSSPNSPILKTIPIPKNIHRQGPAHRSRFIASKRLLATSSTAVAEILGIPSSSPVAPQFSSGLATPDVRSLVEADEHGYLTVSSKSVADYFKEKMRLVVSKSTGFETVTGEAPRCGIGFQPKVSSRDEVEVDGRLRGGLGIGSRTKMSTTTALMDMFEQNEKPEGEGKKCRSEGDEGEMSRKPKKKGKKKSHIVSTSVPRS